MAIFETLGIWTSSERRRLRNSSTIGRKRSAVPARKGASSLTKTSISLSSRPMRSNENHARIPGGVGDLTIGEGSSESSSPIASSGKKRSA